MGPSSSDTEKAPPALRKHNRSSSSDQPSKSQIYISSQSVNNKPMEAPPTPTSPRSPNNNSKSTRSSRPDQKRRKSSASSTAKHKSSRPGYSRKYSTPPSRPLSPSGFPQLLENDMCIPEMDLNHIGTALRNHTQTAPPISHHIDSRPLNLVSYAPNPTPLIQYSSQTQTHSQPHLHSQLNSLGVEVDTAPQEPDIWSDPETDYFSSIEGPASRKAYHARGQSRRQLSQNLSGMGLGSLNAALAGGGNARGLGQIHEDVEEFPDLQIPGGFA